MSEVNDNFNVLSWDEEENRVYEYGVSKGCLYLKDPTTGEYDEATPWNGLINVSASPTGADANKLWADGIEYASLRAAEEFEGSIEAYTYPDAFGECDGSVSPVAGLRITQQNRRTFGLCWRTEVGNAEDNNAGYKLHLAYGLTASPSEKSYDTVNDSPDAMTMSWDFQGVPVKLTTKDASNKEYKPTAYLVIDSTKANATKLAALEKKLYGDGTASTGNDAYLPLPDEVITTLSAT